MKSSFGTTSTQNLPLTPNPRPTSPQRHWVEFREPLDALLAERKASEAQLHALLYAEEAMCGATFSLKGRNCGDLNDSIEKIRKLRNQE